MFNSEGGEHQLGWKRALMRCGRAASEVTALLCLSLSSLLSPSLPFNVCLSLSLSPVFGWSDRCAEIPPSASRAGKRVGRRTHLHSTTKTDSFIRDGAKLSAADSLLLLLLFFYGPLVFFDVFPSCCDITRLTIWRRHSQSVCANTVLW